MFLIKITILQIVVLNRQYINVIQESVIFCELFDVSYWLPSNQIDKNE